MSLSEVIILLTAIATIVTSIIILSKDIKKNILLIKKHLIKILFILLLISFGFIIYFLLPKKEVKPDNSKFGFEMGTMGWKPQDYKDTQGITSVNQSKRKSYLGKYSLELKADLVGRDSSKHKGETHTILTQPLNLEDITISYFYYLPCPSQAAGNPNHPNGFQAFVKDIKYRSEYGRWVNVYSTDKGWKQISFTPSCEEPDNGYKDPDFDPTMIIMVGIKMAIGDSSEAKYKGSIFIDSINWEN